MKRASWCGFFVFMVTSIGVSSVLSTGGCGGKVEEACDPRAQSCQSGGDAGGIPAVSCDNEVPCGSGLAMRRCRTLDANGTCTKAAVSLSDGRSFTCSSCASCGTASANASAACSTPPPDPLDASPPPPPPPPDGAVPLACSPKDEASFTWHVHPPLRVAGACSPEQLKAYHQCLVDQGTGSNPPSCAAFTDPANKACAACLVTPDTAASYGPLISHAALIELNIPGCFSLVSTNLADVNCGGMLQVETACREDACSGCPVTDQASFNDEQACEQSADQGGCSGYAAQAKCADAIPNADVCRAGTDFIDFFDAIAPLFCE